MPDPSESPPSGDARAVELTRAVVGAVNDALGSAASEAVTRAVHQAVESFVAESAGRIARLERLALLGQLSASVVHELRNPLSVIETSAFILADVGRNDERVARHARRIADQVALAAGIVGDLLQAARDRPLAVTSVDLAEVCRAAVAQVPCPAEATVVLDLPADLPRIPADARRLRQVITNLVTNALDATGARGRVVVAARAGSEHVRVTVSDNGPGIPAADLARLFEPLFSTKAHGTGLGLALSREMVRAHGGDLVARNAPDGGACFEVRLPRGGP